MKRYDIYRCRSNAYVIYGAPHIKSKGLVREIPRLDDLLHVHAEYSLFTEGRMTRNVDVFPSHPNRLGCT